ncbi:MAG: hypothetical protein COW62_14255 [Zetaproteobacteria bacterium CG17_big_fil_post_rev_8_21_14_2_50_50_13]|nr:MAG: hypothetical protein COW62_14255 [Zetaproteobacteria bacterium CG17_big_fil_post_rev_8_21_14_2_50_50_13]PIY56902.1 MAG: hypothetical protein COZ00_01840 [Zetaproteobacteria bacterium CG_4_10_14_0_8_um_filter_49_80]
MFIAMAGLHLIGFPWWSIIGWPVWLLVSWITYFLLFKLLRSTKVVDEKPSKFITVAVPVITWFLLFFCAFILVASSSYFEEVYLRIAKPFGHAPTTSNELINTTLSNKTLIHPKNYVWYYSHQTSGKKDMLFLEALYPEMKPYSADNREEFLTTGIGRVIRITVSDQGGIRSDIFQSYYSEKYQLRSDGRFTELSRYLRKVESNDGFGAELYLLGKREQPDFYLICDKYEGYSYPLNPGCEARGEVCGLSIEYVYSRDYLNHWHMIHQRVINLVQSFIQLDSYTCNAEQASIESGPKVRNRSDCK